MRYCFSDFCLDTQRYELRRGDAPIPLRPKVYEALAYLLTHHDRVVLKQELLEHLWPEQAVGDAALNSYIMDIRKALGDSGGGQQLLRTIRGRGYRWMIPVEIETLLPPSPSESMAATETEAPPSASAPATPIAPNADGEYKLASILCGALAEAPALVARLGPEPWFRLRQAAMELIQEVLRRYGGALIVATHDGFTAVFGVPVAQEDHARRAVLAALDLRQCLRDDDDLRALLANDSLSLSMGLDSGLVVASELGQEPQRLATVVGAPLHVATRLQQQADPGAILLSDATYQLVQAEIRADLYQSPHTDKQSTTIYAVQGPLRRQAGVIGRGSRPQSPFVGRERELALLHDHLAEAVGGQGQVVGVVGAPGMGKTRLLTEFCRRVSGDRVTVYEGRCLSYGQATPYLPVRDIVRQLCGLAEGGEPVAQAAAVRLRLQASGVTAEDDMTLLLLLLDLPATPDSLARLSPEARQARTFALLRHLVLEAAQRQPLVLVLENLHWVDPTSAAWLESLAERLPEASILLLGSYRPGYQLTWGAHTAVTQVALAPLRVADSQMIVRSVLGDIPISEVEIQALVIQGGGNPFFLEELAWDTVEQNTLGAPGLAPQTVHAVLAARMDRLPSEAKSLLQIAAVIGPEAPVTLLQALADIADVTLRHELAHLQAAEFLYETRLFPDHVYRFKHALTHEVAYSSLLQERRRLLHARLVDIMESLTPEQGAEQIERLAHHALQGELLEKALSYLYRLGRKAEAQSALLARGWFERALGVFAKLPESPATLEQGFEIRLGIREALGSLGDVRQGLTHLREAETLAARLRDEHRQSRVFASLIVAHVLLGELDAALAAGAQALEIAERLGDLRTCLLAMTHLEQAHYYRGDYQRVATLATDFRRKAAIDGGRERDENTLLVSLYGRYWLILSLSELGRFAEATAYVTEALQLAESTHHVKFIGRLHFAAGRLYLLKGDWAPARAHCERGIAAYQEAHIFLSLHHVVAASAWVLAQVGEASLSLTRLQEGEQLLARQVDRNVIDQHGGDYHALGRAMLLLGRLDEAQNLGERALHYAPSHPGFAAHALHLLGDIAAHPHHANVERSEAYYLQALALAEQCGMRPLVAHCHRGLGAFYAATGQHEQAQAALSTAIEMYLAIDMNFWLPQAKAALAQISGVETPSA